MGKWTREEGSREDTEAVLQVIRDKGSTGPFLFSFFLQLEEEFFNERSEKCIDGLYSAVTIRQIMLALTLKTIPRQRWETCFDRRVI